MLGIERLAIMDGSTPIMTTALPDLPMRQAVMIRLFRIALAGMTDFFEPVFRKLGLTESSFHVLCLLMASRDGRVSPSELSDLVGTSRANMTRILDTLETDGLASRAIDVRDGRRHVIQVTPAGRVATRAAIPQMVGPLDRAFSDLSPDEIALLNKLLRKTILSFDKKALTAAATG